MLSLSGIRKSFRINGEVVTVLGDISFSVNSGEIIGLIGASGVGKTTLLNIVAGEMPFDSGKISWEVDGASQNGATRIKAAMIFQEDTVFPWMRVVDNVAFSRKVLPGAHKDRILGEAAEFLSQLHLEAYNRYWPRELSGGIRKRVELARALFSNPRIILLDEPFSMLDVITRSEVHAWFLDQMRGRLLSALLVTHDIKEAIMLSDRLLVLNGKPASIRLELPGARRNEIDEGRIDEIERAVRDVMTRDSMK